MKYITYEGQVYQYLPGGKRYIHRGEYFENFGQVHQWKEPYKTFAPAWRVIPIQRIPAEEHAV